MPTTDDRTPHLDLPLPHQSNLLAVDVNRLRSALNALDAKIEALDNLLSSDDFTLDTVQEIVNAIKSDQTNIASILANKLDVSTFEDHAGAGGDAHAQATTIADGFMSAADKTKLDGVSLALPFDVVSITPSTNGQTSLTVSGGYTAGRIWLFKNGIKLISGTDFTATNGTSITLTLGASTTDIFEVVRFKRVFVET